MICPSVITGRSGVVNPVGLAFFEVSRVHTWLASDRAHCQKAGSFEIRENR
jgi:hypothetical protein